MSRGQGHSSAPERRGPCALKGCETKVGYKTLSGGVRKLSKYCKYHTCQAKHQHIIGGGNFCRYPKDPSATVKYCQIHRQCGVQGCPQSGENPVHELPWYCASHQCAHPGCIKPRFGGSTYCQGHPQRCSVGDCGKPTDGLRKGCPDHSCEIVGCREEAPRHNRCDAHYPCSVQGCNGLRRNAANVWFCDRHTCDVRGCPQRAENGGRCRNHLPCSTDGCGRIRAPGKAFCAAHNCNVDGCVNEQTRRHRCDEHLPCGREGCDRFQARDRFGDGMAGYCERHIPCRREDCPNPVAGRDEDFCRHHKCLIFGCSSEREGRSQFCHGHTCRAASCVQPLSDLESRDARFCQLHECGEGGCVDRARKAEGFCNLHGCAEESCSARRSPESRYYCDDHRCRVSGCTAEGKSRGQYCFANRHACVEPGCGSQRLQDESATGLCLPHFRQHAEHQAARETQRSYEERLQRQARENERLRRQYEQTQRAAEQREREEAAAAAAARRRAREEADARAAQLRREEEARARAAAERQARERARARRQEEERLRREEEARARAAADFLAREELLREERDMRRRDAARRRAREEPWDEDEFNGGW